MGGSREMVIGRYARKKMKKEVVAFVDVMLVLSKYRRSKILVKVFYIKNKTSLETNGLSRCVTFVSYLSDDCIHIRRLLRS